MSIAIRVENLGKKYKIRHEQHVVKRQKALRDILTDSAGSLFKPKSKHGAGKTIQNPKLEDFWALKDISFEIKRGEAVGIVGRNGAGKSTLLKLLSRITEPSSGRIELEGRVSSLLEVGTGFHSELTGRENIYLNGAILGMSRLEIKRKFDEIVAFAEVEKFLDTPVKRYSSGMYVRLAFAVAAHLEPEILIVDEVLAVGDAQFQNKCLGKMEDVSKHGGRTVLFVSHNEAVVRRLCPRVILLSQGKIAAEGSPEEVYRHYRMRGLETSSGFSSTGRTHCSDKVAIKNACLMHDGIATSEFLNGGDMIVSLEIAAFQEVRCSIEVLIRDNNSFPIMFCPCGLAFGRELKLEAGTRTVQIRLKPPFLAAGTYSLDLVVADTGRGFYDYIEEALGFRILECNIPATGWVFLQAQGQGCVLMEAEVLQ